MEGTAGKFIHTFAYRLKISNATRVVKVGQYCALFIFLSVCQYASVRNRLTLWHKQHNVPHKNEYIYFTNSTKLTVKACL